MKVCVESIRSKFGIDAGMVLEAMIEFNCNNKATDVNPVTASMDAILEGARGKPGGIQMTLEHVRTILEQIGCRLCIEESGALYTIDLKGIIETCQNAEIESLVLKRYGKEAYRIFGLLAKDGGQKRNGSEKKESQRLLYKLWKDSYLDMEILAPKQALQEQQREERNSYRKRWMILQSSLVKLDDALMLFLDF